MNDEQLTQRMRAASDAIEMSDTAQARHLEAISAALTTGADTSDDTVVPLSRASRRRRIVASVVAAAVIAPAGLAAASDGSIPGDALYPVKQLSERVLVLFDSDVIARHRIEEIEALEAEGRFDAELYDDAREALAELGEGHPLWERLSGTSAVDADDDRDEAPDQDHDRSEPEPIEPVTIELELPDGSEATFTLAGDELIDVTPPAGWTVTELDDDEATLRSKDFEVEVRVREDGSLETEVIGRNDDDGSNAPDDSDVAEDGASDDDEVQPSAPSEDFDDDDGSESERDDDPEDRDDPGDDNPSEDA